jgi:hypothetical protein
MAAIGEQSVHAVADTMPMPARFQPAMIGIGGDMCLQDRLPISEAFSDLGQHG